jgi:GT2 family glycosyltransferase
LRNPPLVSIVVLSHDRPTYLPLSLDSIMGQSYPNLEIIVVDNKSRSSDEIARLVNQYTGVRLVRNGENLGFTGGMNRGIEAATGDYVHCTLDDVILDQDCISHLVEYAREHLSDGLLSGIIYDESGEKILCAGGEFLLTPIYRQKVFGAGEADAGQFPEPFNVKCIQGGMVFSELEFMRRMKGFREDFFIYSDSIELSARVLKTGNPITIVPRAKIRVIDAPHAFTPEGIAFHKVKNLFALYLLHARLRVLPEFFLRYAMIAFLRHLFSNRKYVLPMMKAWGWCLMKAPSLLKQRYQHFS